MPINSRDVLLIIRARNEAAGIINGVIGGMGAFGGAISSANQKLLGMGAVLTGVGAGFAAVGAGIMAQLNDATNFAAEYG
jgi:uncharacterized membrane protein